jgi:hypothetical protein
MTTDPIYDAYLNLLADGKMYCRAFTTLPLPPYTWHELNACCGTWISPGVITTTQKPQEILTGDLLATQLEVTFTPGDDFPASANIFGVFFDTGQTAQLDCGYHFFPRPMQLSYYETLTLNLGIVVLGAGSEG